MKKLIKRIVLFILFTVFVLNLFSGCGHSWMIGKWQNEGNYNNYFVLKDDGTYLYSNSFGSKHEGKYTIEDNVIHFDTPYYDFPDFDYEFKKNGRKLIIIDEGKEFTFKKVD